MLLTFLGTGGHVGDYTRAAPCIALARMKDAWLFDAGEDTQRQFSKAYHIRPGKVPAAAAAAAVAQSHCSVPQL